MLRHTMVVVAVRHNIRTCYTHGLHAIKRKPWKCLPVEVVLLRVIHRLELLLSLLNVHLLAGGHDSRSGDCIGK